MRLDTANRAFLTLAAVGFAAYILVGLAACAVLTLVAYRVSMEGPGVLAEDGSGLGFAVVFLALVGAGAILGLWSLHAQILATRGLVDSVRRLKLRTPPALQDAAERTGLPTRRLHVVEASEACSFTYGIPVPRVAISRRLIEVASPEELQAVLEHEGYHVRNLDPLKVLLARSLVTAFFYLPVLRDLRRRYVAGRELAADRRAIEACGSIALAAALYKVVGDPVWADLGTAAAIGGAGLLDVRVAQLEEGSEPPLPRISRGALALSAIGLGVLVAGPAVSLAATGGPFVAMHRAMPVAIPIPLRIAGLTACTAFWAWVAWLVLTGLWRARDSLTLSSSRSTTDTS